MTERSVLHTSARPFVISGLLALVLLTFGFGLWATQTELSGAIITPGYVQADLKRQVVQHATGGVVEEVLVRDGTLVQAGDTLARLDTKKMRAELAFAHEQLFDLATQKVRLRASANLKQQITFDPDLLASSARDPVLRGLLEGQRGLFRATRATLKEQRNQLRQQMAQITAQIAGINGQRDSLNVQLELIRRAMENQKSLFSRGLSQASAVLDLEREISRLEGDLAQLAARRAQAKERIAGIEVERLQRIAAHREKSIELAIKLEQPMRRLRNEIQMLTTQIAQAEIRAPISGIVHLMQVQSPSAVLRPAEPLLYLVSQDRPRVIVARVLPKNIDQVNLGQLVKLRLSAMQEPTSPEVVGHVSRISADAIVDDATGRSYFSVEVTPNKREIRRLHEKSRLLPGMPVDVFFQTGAWSPMHYLAKPVKDYFTRAFRES